MSRLTIVAAIGALALLAACADTAGGGVTPADADRQGALNECRTRAAIAVSPAAGRGLVGSSNYDQAVAQCLRNIRKTETP